MYSISCDLYLQLQSQNLHPACRFRHSEWDNPFQPEGHLSQDADRMVMMWKEGTLGQEYSREYETDSYYNNEETVKDTVQNISDANPQVSGNILPRKPTIMDISTVDMLDKSSDNEKMQANCCVL